MEQRRPTTGLPLLRQREGALMSKPAPERTPGEKAQERITKAYEDIENGNLRAAQVELAGARREVAALEQEVAWCDKRIENWYKPEVERLHAAIRDHVDANGVTEAKRTYAKLRRIARALTKPEGE